MYTKIKPVIPTYLVQTTKDGFCYVEAGRCTVDTGHGIILFNEVGRLTIQEAETFQKEHAAEIEAKKKELEEGGWK